MSDHPHECGEACDHEHHELDQEQLDALMEQVTRQLQLVVEHVPLPQLFDPDDPLFGVFLDQPERDERRGEILQHVMAEQFDGRARAAVLEQLDLFLAVEQADEPRQAAEIVRGALLEPQSYIDTDWIRFQLSNERFYAGLQQYITFWREHVPDEALLAATSDLQAAEEAVRAPAVERLAAAGREGVQAVLVWLEQEYVEILADHDALEEKGAAPLLAAIDALSRVPSLGAATVLCDQLAIVNHAQIERRLFDALRAMPQQAMRVAAEFLRFEPLQPATRFVLHELLHGLGAPEAALLLAAEFRGVEPPMGDEDLEDLAELWATAAGPRMSLMAVQFLEEAELPQGARDRLEQFLEAADEPELVAWARGRVAEQLPVLFWSSDEVDVWADRLAERWACEAGDPRIGEALAQTPAVPLFLYSPHDADPGPGPREQFLEKICEHEVAAEAPRLLERLPEKVPLEEAQAWLAQNWWLQPRAESGWKPPMLALLEERRERLPDHAGLRALKLDPLAGQHVAAACRLLHHGQDLRQVDQHLLIARELLPRTDPLLGYAEVLRMAADHATRSPKLWIPGEPEGRAQRKVGRNDPCPCGSGKKYKKCCLQG